MWGKKYHIDYLMPCGQESMLKVILVYENAILLLTS